MPNIKIQREPIYKALTGAPGRCPKCGGVLEKAYQSYLIVTRTGSHMDDSFVTGGDFGWFCLACPVVVLNNLELSEMLRSSAPGWKVGKEFWVVGILDFDAVPANKRHLPLGAPENPLPLVEFLAPKSQTPAPKPERRKKHE